MRRTMMMVATAAVLLGACTTVVEVPASTTTTTTEQVTTTTASPSTTVAPSTTTTQAPEANAEALFLEVTDFLDGDYGSALLDIGYGWCAEMNVARTNGVTYDDYLMYVIGRAYEDEADNTESLLMDAAMIMGAASATICDENFDWVQEVGS